MKSTGIIRRVDELGRVVIPIEIRNQFNIIEKDPIEIYVEGGTIVLKKFLYTNIVDYDKFLTFSTKLNLTIMKLLEDKRIKLANPSADIYFSRK